MKTVEHKSIGETFYDGLINIFSSLANRRSAMATNRIAHRQLQYPELRALYKNGLGAKIVKIKSGHALNDTLQFDSEADKDYYAEHLARDVLKATRFMIGFGRGIIVLYQNGDLLSTPFVPDENRSVKQRVFSGDMVTVSDYGRDFEDERYYKPIHYSVRGQVIHWSRVVDFTYFEPTEEEAPSYAYGGLSEFELIYPQMINDGVVERASGSIVEKNATIFYKLANFRNSVQSKQDKDVIDYISKIEDHRSMYGAGIIDKDDEVITVSQALTNLSEVDNITLRRLAMVTGIPLAWLIGENVKGLNSTGDNERQIFQDMIEAFENDYLVNPVNELLRKHRRGKATFKNNQGETALVRVGYEKTVIENAKALSDMGEDYVEYLERHDVIQRDAIDEFFKEENDEELTPEDLVEPPIETPIDSQPTDETART